MTRRYFAALLVVGLAITAAACNLLIGNDPFTDGSPAASGRPDASDVGDAGDGGTVPRSPIVRVGAGGTLSCAIRESGEVECWGGNASGELGRGADASALRSSYTPGKVVGLTDAVEVAGGDGFACARRRTGKVSCWGTASAGGLGNGSYRGSDVPVEVTDLTDATSLSVNRLGACVVRGTGQVACWGRLTTDPDGGASPVPVVVPNVTEATRVTLGSDFACAVRKDQTVTCWGSNRGQFGAPVSNDGGATWVAPAQPIADLSSVIQVVAAESAACALLADKTVRCWGNDFYGTSGNGAPETGSQRPLVVTPTRVVGVDDAVELTSMRGTICARTGSGKVLCWGENGYGLLGRGAIDPDLAMSATPAPVQGLDGVRQIASAGGHTCALTANGIVSCWGINSRGEVGIRNDSSGPVTVNGLQNVTDIAARRNAACAVANGGNVYCWGAGPLGDGSRASSAVPVRVANVQGATAVALSSRFGCARLASGAVSCWGKITQTGTEALAAEPLAGISDALELAGQQDASAMCARRAGGQPSPGAISCWGDQFSNAKDAFVSSSSALDFGGGGTSGVAIGVGHSCLVLSTPPGVFCFGSNTLGMLGNGTTNTSHSLTLPAVNGTGDAAQLVAGAYHTCARRQGGQVKCWGANEHGQLGNNTSTSGPTSNPVDVYQLSDAVEIAASSWNTCARRANDSVVCWGWSGNLGYESNDDALYPSKPVPGVAGVTKLAVGHRHACARKADGTAICWGEAIHGALGDGSLGFAATAVQVKGLE